MTRWMVFIYLGICSITDLRCREISIKATALFGGLGIVLQICQGRLSWVLWVGGIIIGICLAGVSRLTREALGYGDCLTLMVTGSYLGFTENMELFLGGLTCAALAAVILLVFCKVNRKYKVPFVPFLFLAQIVISLTKWKGMG